MTLRRALRGHPAAPGNALGRARVRIAHALEVPEQHIQPTAAAAELARLHAAIARVRAELHHLRAELHGALAQEVGEFLDLHALLLDDPELLQGLDDLIARGHYSADYALRVQRDRLAAVFERMDDAYFRSRIEDIDQVIKRIHAALHQQDSTVSGLAGEIVLADGIAPAEIVQLQAQGILAVVTAGGSPLSHSAILARSLHLPLVVGIGEALQQVNDGDAVLVDGGSGEVIIAPDADDLRRHRARLRNTYRAARQRPRPAAPARTVDGVDIHLYANADSPADVRQARALGALGVGLYRTELMFLQHGGIPDEEAQYLACRALVREAGGASVTIRTLDIGADKLDSAGLAPRDEPNPALGLRGVRLSLAKPELLNTQLRAILRASAHGPVRILVPMVSGREQLQATGHAITRAADELRGEGHAIAGHVPLGAMVEVPAAAIALSACIDLVDFIAVGTNDLVQYLLAADRINDGLDGLYTPLHPALPRVLHAIVKTARAHRKPVSVCGEMAGECRFTPLLLALGVTELSMHPSHLAQVRETICCLDFSALRARLPALLRARDHASLLHWLQRTRTQSISSPN